jgi:hypothetical protein
MIPDTVLTDYGLQCSANWNEMLPTSCGRFCESCNKTVIDFTAHSTQDIDAYFKANPGTCGRFRLEQVERDKIPLRVPIRIPSAMLIALTTAAITPILAPAMKPGIRLEQPIHPDPFQSESYPDSLIRPNKVQICPIEPAVPAAEVHTTKNYSNPKGFYLSWEFPFIHKKRRTWLGCPHF